MLKKSLFVKKVFYWNMTLLTKIAIFEHVSLTLKKIHFQNRKERKQALILKKKVLASSHIFHDMALPAIFFFFGFYEHFFFARQIAIFEHVLLTLK